MRMWMVDAKTLCKNHLLGEHSELHKCRHNFEKKHSIKGRVYPIVLIEPDNMQKRHDELAVEMLLRGYKHESEYVQPDISYLPIGQQHARADIEYNLKDLKNRCEECCKRIEGETNK